MHNIKINFYKLREINPIELYCSIGEETKYNFELYKKYYEYELNETKKYYDNSTITCEEKTVEELMDEVVFEKLTEWQIYYEPLIYNEEEILEHGLLPIQYEGKNLIACEEWNMDSIYKLKKYALFVTGRGYNEIEYI